MKKLLPVLVVLFFMLPSVSLASGLTSQQATSLIAVVQSSPSTPASVFVPLITSFSNITINQAVSLIAVVQAAPSVPASAFVNLLISFTADTPITQPATPAITPIVTTQPAQTNQQTTQPVTPAIPATPAVPATPTSSTTPAVPATPASPTPIPTPPPPSPVVTALPIKDNFNLYALGSVVGQGGWKTYTNYGTNFIVQSATTSEGVGALYNNSVGDAVATKSGSLTTDGVQAVYVRTENRSNWKSYTDGNAQVRVSKGEWGTSEIFSAVSFKSDGNVAFFDGNSYANFATYNDNEWTLLEIQWRSNDAKARYRLNQGIWTDWYNIRNKSNSSFTGLDNVGFDFVGGGVGVYYDDLH